MLTDVTLHIPSGDFTSIVGPNGGGKTTLVKLMLGLLEPAEGSIKLLGRHPRQGRKRAGYMPQHLNTDPLFPVSALDVVLMGRAGRWWKGRNTKHDGEISIEALEEVGLAGIARRRFGDLSGGERQRVLIARALVTGPEILILDEPTSNIDPQSEEHLLAILRRLNKRMTILIVSHDIGFVSGEVRSVICVNRRVAMHPTSALDGELIKDLYGVDMRLIRHDHSFERNGHPHA